MENQKEIIKHTLGTLVQASSKLYKLLHKNKPRLDPEQLGVLEEVQKHINKSITTLQHFNPKE